MDGAQGGREWSEPPVVNTGWVSAVPVLGQDVYGHAQGNRSPVRLGGCSGAPDAGSAGSPREEPCRAPPPVNGNLIVAMFSSFWA